MKMKPDQLFTIEYDVRNEKPVNLSLFKLLSSMDEDCALYKPVGEPVLKSEYIRPTSPEKKEVLRYEEKKLIAINLPEPLSNTAIAQVYDHERQCTYYINNLEKTIRTEKGVCESIHTDKARNLSFTFKGTVDDIIEKFEKNNYRFI